MTGREVEPREDARDDDDVERFLADLGRIGRRYVARASEPTRPRRTAEMDQALTDAWARSRFHPHF